VSPKITHFHSLSLSPPVLLERRFFLRILSSQFDCRNSYSLQKSVPTMDEENISRPSSERSSLEVTLLDKEKHNDETSETSKVSNRKSILRRILIPLTIHFAIFMTYSALVLLAWSPRSRDAHKARNLLYCMSINEPDRYSTAHF
jgi:hypothetical protein